MESGSSPPISKKAKQLPSGVKALADNFVQPILDRFNAHAERENWSPRRTMYTFAALVALPGVAMSATVGSFFVDPAAGFTWYKHLLVAALTYLLVLPFLFAGMEVWRRKVLGVARPPASRIVSALRWVFFRKTFENIFAQMIIDGRIEHEEALIAGQTARARWIEIALVLNLTQAVAMWLVISVIKRGMTLWRMGS